MKKKESITAPEKAANGLTSVAGDDSVSKSIGGRLLTYAFMACLMLCFTASTAFCQDPPPNGTTNFDFTTWFGYDPIEWAGIVFVLIGGLIALVIPFKIGVRYLMKVVAWMFKAMGSK